MKADGLVKSAASRRAFDEFQPSFSQLQFVLIGLRPRWTLHLRRSPSNHSYGYAFDSGHPALHAYGASAAHCSYPLPADLSADQPNCFAQHALIPNPFMQSAGLGYELIEPPVQVAGYRAYLLSAPIQAGMHAP